MQHCLFCGKNTANPKFCSRSCAAKENNKTPKKKKKIYACCVCGNSISCSRKRTYCDTCLRERKFALSERSLRYDQSKRKYQINSNVRANARQIMIRAGIQQSCRACGYDRHVEACHIKAISSFGDDATFSEVNSIRNLVFLCPNCHWEFDKGLLNLDFTEFDNLHS